jgi:rod shape-determining protein MreC
MPVVTERGLVGRVETVYPTLSKVRLIIDTSSAVSALVQRTRATGVVKGQPGGELVLDYLPQGQDVVAVGDVVLTSGAGGGFPRQLVIGQVIEIRQKDYEMFQQAVLRPTVDFDRLEVVLIITNFVPLSLEGLEPAPGTAGP